MYRIEKAIFPRDLKAVLDIYREYVESTTVDLGFQENEKEFVCLAEKYSSNESQIYLAYMVDQVVGCAAFRKVNDDMCEMKRVYVRPVARGKKVGAKLVRRIIEESRSMGFKTICLDVLPEFQTALKLYKSYGFTAHEPITHNPVPGTEFLGLDLAYAGDSIPVSVVRSDAV